MRFIIFTFLIMAAQSLSAQTYYLFTGTYTNGPSKGIYVFRFNSSTGTLSPAGTIATENPSYLALSKDNQTVYAVNENGGDKKPTISAFSFNHETATLKLLNAQPANGDAPCYVSVDALNKWVVAGNYSGGNFSVYPIQSGGNIGEAVQVVAHAGSSVDKDRQEKPHVHSVVFTPDKRFLAVADLGTDKIYLYPFNADSKKPIGETPMEFPTTPGAGPRHIVFHKTMPYAYVIEELSGNVTAYKYFGGKLTRIQSISSHPAGFKGEIGSAAIRISGDGRFLYASNRGSSNTISIFALNKKTGKLSSKGFQDCLGEGPRDFNIDPSGRYLVCVNGKSNQLVVFARNKATGLLTPSGTPVEIPTPVSVEFMYMK